MKIRFNIICVIIILTGTLFSQSTSVMPQPTDLVTCPTAGILPRGSFLVDATMYRDGGLLFGMSVGVSGNLMFGISYGGSEIIGNNDIEWNEQPGVEVKYRIFEEGISHPAVAIGFNSEGYGAYLDYWNRYEQKAKGFYGTISKNFDLLGNLGFHGGVNFNPLENSGDKDRDLSFFVGIDKDINSEISVFGEWDAGINDNDFEIFNEGKGYLNAGVRINIIEHFHFEVLFTDILENNKYIENVNRELRVNFVEFF